MLSDEARQFFHERGYVWLQDLVDAMTLQEELKPLHTEITGQGHPDGSISWRVERLWSPSEKRRKRREVFRRKEVIRNAKRPKVPLVL